ncbi:MAG TPA: hypothetical protein PLY66_04035 [Acidobacteriota bacterium]|nr:hypothetical protein [Acidobacteriota bacterium]HQF88055.1 hypothetical protein [Acidobacteriota bacterium]HQG92135.1 hypothetical protein [Acidobacteriota bacterium]HQK88383.1 hypothetical protein [Acidobacteriota bacterium]
MRLASRTWVGSAPTELCLAALAAVMFCLADAPHAARWETVATGGNTVNTAGGEICIDAMKAGAAYIYQPRTYGYDRDYAVSFDFQLQVPDGHWLTLFDDGFIHVATDWGATITHFQTGRPYKCVPPIMTLELNRWYHFRIEARPQQKAFDLFVDGKRVGGAVNLEPGVAAAPNVPTGSIELGDSEPTAYNRGKGCWRNLSWTAPGGGQPPPPPPPADPGSLEGEWTITWRGSINQTHTLSFTRSGGGFTGRYTDTNDVSVFTASVHTGRGGRVVSILQSNVTGNIRDDYFAVYGGILRDGVIEGTFCDVQGHQAEIRLVRTR